MHENQEKINMQNLHQMNGSENCSASDMDPYDDYCTQDEDDMENEEIEAMLYSQLYFEPHESDKITQLAGPTDYTIKVEKEERGDYEEKDSLAAMVNFSGRSYMSPSDAIPDKENTTEMLLPVKKSRTKKKEKCVKKTGSKMDKCREKKAKSKEVVLVLSDSSIDCEEEKRMTKKTGIQKNGRKFISKRSADSLSSLPVKKLKKAENEVIIVKSSSDEVTESDSDVVNDKWSDVGDDNIDLALNVNGIWNPVRSQSPDLRAINLQTWDGDPPLTVDEVHSLLTGSNWTIDDDDRYGLLRSYGKKIVCKNCNEKGHSFRDCPKPKKVPKCAMCGIEGHRHWRCPNALCYNCNLPGHSSRMCSAPRKSHKVICNRCGFPGHIQSACPELWRQYHLTTKPGPLQESVQNENKAAFCYNCGDKGHYGHECDEEKINEYLHPWSPFITRYSKPKEDKHNRLSFEVVKEKRSKKSYAKERRKKKKLKMQNLKGVGKTVTENDTKNENINKKARKKKKKKAKQLSGPDFLTKALEKVHSMKQPKQNANQTKRKVFDEEVDNFVRNKKPRKNVDKNNRVKTNNHNQDGNNISKTKRKMKKVFGNVQDGVAENRGIKNTQHSKKSAVHTIFDSPVLFSEKSDKKKDKKKVKEDRKVIMNKRGFNMTIYN